jgi:hypothetical protein
MSGELSIPPLRELPPGRLVQRIDHLRAELAGEQRPLGITRKRTALLAFGALLALAAALLATPAFGLRERVSHLFASDKEQHPPALIQRLFRNMYDARPDEATGVIPGKARVAIRSAIPGFGHKTLWVAPTRAGGFCWSLRCNRTRRSRFQATLEITGPTSTNSSPRAGSADQHVFFVGATIIPAAHSVEMQFEDGDVEPIPLVWVSKPIDAGFFQYLLPRSHWKPGERPVALVVKDAAGRELARDTMIGAYFRESQRYGLAPPPKGLSHWWFLLAVVPAIVLAGVMYWRRRVTRYPRPSSS